MNVDLHLHSFLSPCGDEEMNPQDLVGMAKVCGLELIALTDHNSAKNCPAAAEAAKQYGIGFIPGIEVNTSEEIHCVCYFPTVEAAMAFDRMLYDHLPMVSNRPKIFGEQKILNVDGTTACEDKLLLTASDISILDLPDLVAEYDGLCWPAHVDRDANGLFAVLGSWPEELKVPAVEIQETRPREIPVDLKVIRSSDAHDFLRMNGAVRCDLPLRSADFAGLYEYVMTP